MRYVTLNPAPAGAPLATASPAMSTATSLATSPATTIAPVQLTAVHLPAVLDRPEVVMLAAPNRLIVDDDDRWGAPLAQMMRSTLAQDLLTRLPAGSFVLPDAPAPAGTRTLVVTVLDCEADANGKLTMQAEWSLLSAQPDSQPGAQPDPQPGAQPGAHSSTLQSARQSPQLSTQQSTQPRAQPGGPQRTVLRRQVALDARFSGHDAPAQAAALSAMLGELADGIAASIVAAH